MMQQRVCRVAASRAFGGRPLCTSDPAPKTFILEYSYVENIIEKRAPVRPLHLEHIEAHRDASSQRPTVVVGGAFPAENPTGAYIIFQANSPDQVQQFAENDPYVKADLVTEFKINEWAVVVGGFAALP